MLQVQFSSVTQSCPTLCDPMDCSMPGFPVHHQFPRFAQTHVHQVSDAISPFHLSSSPFPPTLDLSLHQGLFQWLIILLIWWSAIADLIHIRWLRNWNFSLSISPSNKYSGLISFRIDWLDLLAVQGTIKRLLQHHSSKASILRCSALWSNSYSLFKLMSSESVVLSNYLIVCCLLLLLPSIFLSIRVFSNELALLIRWPKYWNFSISPSNEYSGLISFRIDIETYRNSKVA